MVKAIVSCVMVIKMLIFSTNFYQNKGRERFLALKFGRWTTKNTELSTGEPQCCSHWVPTLTRITIVRVVGHRHWDRPLQRQVWLRRLDVEERFVVLLLRPGGSRSYISSLLGSWALMSSMWMVWTSRAQTKGLLHGTRGRHEQTPGELLVLKRCLQQDSDFSYSRHFLLEGSSQGRGGR